MCTNSKVNLKRKYYGKEIKVKRRLNKESKDRRLEKTRKKLKILFSCLSSYKSYSHPPSSYCIKYRTLKDK